jgi:hypothetical protein
MDQRSGYGRVMPVQNLQDYFRTSIDEVIAGQGVDIDPHATHYVVNMMTLFSRSEHFYEDGDEASGLRPLALMLADAADSPTPEHRNQTLKRIGDVALFVAGFFTEGLRDKAVDVDYYMHMGQNAYGSLSEEVRGTLHGKAFADIYLELALKFRLLMDVLGEVRGSGDQDLVRTFEVWRKTGSQRAERLLREQGVFPIGGKPVH